MWRDANYTTTELLHSDERVSLYRGVRNADQRRVLIRVLGPTRRRPQDVRRLQHACQLGAQMRLRSLVRPLALVQSADGPALILEDDGSDMLEHRLGAPMELLPF